MTQDLVEIVSSKNTTLKRLKKTHMRKTYEWIKAPKFRKEFMLRGEVSWEIHVDYFNKLLMDSTQQGYAIFLDNVHIGNCGFKAIDSEKKSAELWIYIGSVEARGMGVGGRAIALLIKNGKNYFSLSRIYVHVSEQNKFAKKLYKNNGFIESGTCNKEWLERSANMLKMLWKK
jgi:RimJ/RimL family protein N-acetyltransferase